MIIHIPDNCKIPLKSFVDFVERYGYQIKSIPHAGQFRIVEKPPNPLDVAIKEPPVNSRFVYTA